MSRVFLTCGVNSSTNLGTAAQIISFSKTLKSFISDVSLNLFSFFPDVDRGFFARYDINVLPHSLNSQHVLISMVPQFPNLLNFILEKNNSITVDFSGDAITDKLVKTLLPTGLLTDMLPIIISIYKKQPVILFSQSIGPFSNLSYPFARLVLRKTKVIMVREHASYNYLKAMQLSPSALIKCSEVAFLLEAIPPSADLFKRDYNRPLIGFSISAFQGRRFNNYRNSIACLLKWIVNELNGRIIFVPHVIDPDSDDRAEARRICALVPDIKDSVTLIEAQLSPEEAKGLIGECDVFVAGRWHASIGSLSQSIPTIALGHSQKFFSTMRHLGLADYVVNMNNYTIEDLINKTQGAWDNRRLIRQDLADKIKSEQASAKEAVGIIANMIKKC